MKRRSVLPRFVFSAAIIVAIGNSASAAHNGDIASEQPVLQPKASQSAALAFLNVAIPDSEAKLIADGAFSVMVALGGKNQSDLTEKQHEKLKQERAIFEEEMALEMPGYRKILAPYYAKNFSEPDLQALTLLFKTPIYQKYSADLPILATEAKEAMQPWLKEVLPSVIAKAETRVRNGDNGESKLLDNGTAPTESRFAVAEELVKATIPKYAILDAVWADATRGVPYCHDSKSKLDLPDRSSWQLNKAGHTACIDPIPKEHLHSVFRDELSMELDSGYVKIMASLLRKHFTDEEIGSLVDLESTPIYQKYTAETAAIMNEASSQIAQWSLKADTRALQRLDARLDKGAVP